MEREEREAHLRVLKKELDWLKKEKKSQISRIEKRIFSRKKEAKESQMIFARYIVAGALSFFFIGGPLYYRGIIDNDYAAILLVIISLVGGIIFGEIIHKLKSSYIEDEAERRTKELASDPKKQFKTMSKDERERQKIIEQQIKEREDAIELTINSNRKVDTSYRLDIPDVVIKNEEK